MTILTTAWQGQARLTCLARTEETADCASFILAAPEGQHIEFQPGQFICLGSEIGGQMKMRAYSIASDVREKHAVRVAVRRVPGGLVSNWLLDNVQPGVCVDALAPAGEFHLDAGHHLAATAPKHVALFSAGCGITPMMSMTYWMLAHRPDVQIHFFHSAHDESNLIFAAETARLADEHARFHLYRFLSRPEHPQECFSGRIDADAVRCLLPVEEAIEAYMCGPQVYMDLLSGALRDHGVAENAIHSESFFTPEVPVAMQGAATQAHVLSVPAFGRELEIATGDSLLDALEREGLPIIGACRSGVCGSCRCKVIDGSTQSSTSGPLSQDDVAAGFVLACSTHAQSDIELEIG